MIDFASQTQGLVEAISQRALSTGAHVAHEMTVAADPLLEWLGYLRISELTGNCDECLDGVRSLILEGVCGASAGLYRSCLLSLRGQIDLALTWLFFKDHRIEWERVVRENEGYRLKKDVLEYLKSYYPKFDRRFDILKAKRKRNFEDPYRVLSAHVHSVGSSTIPSLTDFSDIVSSEEVCLDCVKIQIDVSEYISDILFSCFASKWASLPPSIMSMMKQRVGEDKIANLVDS